MGKGDCSSPSRFNDWRGSARGHKTVPRSGLILIIFRYEIRRCKRSRLNADPELITEKTAQGSVSPGSRFSPPMIKPIGVSICSCKVFHSATGSHTYPLTDTARCRQECLFRFPVLLQVRLTNSTCRVPFPTFLFKTGYVAFERFPNVPKTIHEPSTTSGS